ncbi:MAG TPA: alpha/beta hydrolase [Pyrinomonadaceae bacterium]|jgi:pimeloyl-ACP methyl ester carboxylesterase
MPHTKVGGLQLYYETQGRGEPVVLIPGFRTGLWLWFKQMEALARKFRVIVFDPRGIGQSADTGEPFTIEMLADDLAGLLGALGIEWAHVLGASFGGFVAQEFAIKYPQMTRSLVLCCTSSGGARHLLPSASALQALATVEGLNTEERTRKDLLRAFAPEFVSERPGEVEAFIARRLRHPVKDWAHFAQLQAAAAFDASERISEIKAPTLVLTGDEDEIVPPGNSLYLAAQIPQARLVRVAGGSHMFFVEQPEKFNRAVIDFIEQATSPDS